MSNPTGQHHQQHFPFHNAPQPKSVQHPPEPTVQKAITSVLPPALPINVIITGAECHITIISAVAKDGSTSKIGVGEDAAGHTSRGKMKNTKKIWSAIATLTMVICAVIGVVVQLA